MTQPPKLTGHQREKLKELEPQLHEAARHGDYGRAKRLCREIQDLLRPTKHETRLQQAKIWLYQAAMEAEELSAAALGLESIREVVSERTVVYLDATILLAVCRLRQRRVEEAKVLISECFERDRNIQSPETRARRIAKLAEIFDQEILVASVRRGRQMRAQGSSR